MIEQLMVKDYILFESAFVDFEKGMTVITGETGAGKSLLIDAISYLMGNRIQSNVVRKGKERCILQMVLSRPNNEIVEKLEENGFEVDDQIIIQRTITKNQKSTIRINQQITTNHFVKEIVSSCIDVHSQQDTYELMDPAVQMDLFDTYCKVEDLKKEVRDHFDLYSNSKNEYEQLLYHQLSDDLLDELTEHYNEIDSIWICQEEYDSLLDKINQQSKANDWIDKLSSALYSINKEDGALDLLYDIQSNIEPIEGLEKESSLLKDMYYSLQDLKTVIENQKERLYEEQNEFDSWQEQAFALKKAIRKYGGSLEAMAQKKDEYLEQIEAIIHREDALEKAKKRMLSAEKVYMEKARKLSEIRRSHFDSLAKQLENHFQDLMLENAKFQVQCTEKSPSANGIDSIEFTVSMNRGQPFTPLRISASGGELSRLMLALRVVFQSRSSISTLIFDEIDTGVSGKVAFQMGKKMKTLSQKYQVLCITHLASVAVWADQHFQVSKDALEDSTKTMVTCLDENQTIDELAMMSNGKVTKASQASSRELKQRVKEELHG